MNKETKMDATARGIAVGLASNPTGKVLLVYKHDQTAEYIKNRLRTLAEVLPSIADWETRVVFQRFDEKPQFERPPKITVDEFQDFERKKGENT